MPRAVRQRMAEAPVPANPERSPELVAATWHPLAYLIGQRFRFSDGPRKQRLEVIGVASGSDVWLRDACTRLCRTASGEWVKAMVEEYGLDGNDEPLGAVDWGRLMRPHRFSLDRTLARALIAEAEAAEEARQEVQRMIRGSADAEDLGASERVIRRRA
ncbi:MAG: hypothetical protein ACYCZN_15465 [Candidatus Dormibacteria bacterium]